MKVLQLPSWYLPEGGQFVLNQSKALQEQGIDVHMLANVVLPWRKYKFGIFRFPCKAFFTNENGILHYRCFSRRIPFTDKKNIEKWTNKTVKLFDEYAKKYGTPDIIHAHSSMWAGYAAALIKEKYNIPYVITEHRGRFSENSQNSIALFKSFYKPFLQKAFSDADYIITVSEQLQAKIKQFCERKIPMKTISNIIDTDFFHYKKKENDSGDFSFVNANSFDYAKAYDILLPAFDELCRKFPNTRLVLLGKGFDCAEFQKILDKTEYKQHICFAGFQNKEGVRNYLWESDAFVLSSRIEAQSQAVLEAMSCGRPVVCTQAVPREIAQDFAAIQCQSNSVSELAIAMTAMIERRKTFDEKTISDFAKSICSQEVVAQKIIDIYQQILHR
ncbi:MAG: glycosyltransferase family 4 protein [Prevotellaceae bacterium]|jgi:glycosyltransferase involved in cell wall biosynthesis|nr:glycosyltransferase family 4 protein [Prevotellaceae bacterium]